MHYEDEIFSYCPFVSEVTCTVTLMYILGLHDALYLGSWLAYKFKGWEHAPMVPAQAVLRHRVEEKAPKPFIACVSSWGPFFCAGWLLIVCCFLYIVSYTAFFCPRNLSTITTLMPTNVTFIISMVIVIPKSPADEWIEDVAIDCLGGVWCCW